MEGNWAGRELKGGKREGPVLVAPPQPVILEKLQRGPLHTLPSDPLLLGPRPWFPHRAVWFYYQMLSLCQDISFESQLQGC